MDKACGSIPAGGISGCIRSRDNGEIEKRHKAEMETGSVLGIKRITTYIVAQDSLHNNGIGYLE